MERKAGRSDCADREGSVIIKLLRKQSIKVN